MPTLAALLRRSNEIFPDAGNKLAFALCAERSSRNKRVSLTAPFRHRNRAPVCIHVAAQDAAQISSVCGLQRCEGRKAMQ
jgi:hypothetical protein